MTDSDSVSVGQRMRKWPHLFLNMFWLEYVGHTDVTDTWRGRCSRWPVVTAGDYGICPPVLTQDMPFGARAAENELLLSCDKGEALTLKDLYWLLLGAFRKF